MLLERRSLFQRMAQVSPIIPNGRAIKNGIRQPQSRSSLRRQWSKLTPLRQLPAQTGNRTKVQPAAHKATFTVRGDSATNIDAPVYSPPTEKPCASYRSTAESVPKYQSCRRTVLANTERTDRHNHNSDSEDLLGPYLSPNIPKKSPPSGRIRKERRKWRVQQPSARWGQPPGKNFT